MISAALAACAFAVVFHVNIIRPRLRRWRLREPVDARFLVTSSDRQKLDYIVQDAEEHTVAELVLPSHTEVSIQILLTPRLAFRSSEYLFGCNWLEPMPGIKRPQPIEFFLPFIEKGKLRSATPDTDENHYLDYNKFYHVLRSKQFVRGQDVVLGFKLDTGDAGVYRAELGIVSEEIEGKAELSLRIEDEPRTKMRCVSKEHQRRGCTLRPTPR